MEILSDALQRAFDRIAEVATANNLCSPLNIRLVDADMRCLVAMEMRLDAEGWHGEMGTGDLESRTGISFPWFIVAEDPTGLSVRIRVEVHEPSAVN